MIKTKTKEIQVYFVLTAIQGDNAGLNTILGYTENFSANYFCHFCKMHKNETKFSSDADDTVLRAKANYQSDVAKNDLSLTGLKEECVFNNAKHFHCTKNLIADIMHDLPEGILPLELGLIFHQLVLARTEIAQLVSKFRSGPDRIFHMWPQGGTWCGSGCNHIGL